MTVELYKNTFVTLEEAQEYFEDRFDSVYWFNLSEEMQEKLLICASRKINSFDYVGCMLSDDQPMAFPRNYQIPQDIKDAVCEEAYVMAQRTNDVHLKNQENNISSISLGAGSVSYNTKSYFGEDKILLSSLAQCLVRKWTKKGFSIGMT